MNSSSSLIWSNDPNKHFLLGGPANAACQSILLSFTQGYIFIFVHSYVMTGLECAFLSQGEKIQILDNPLTNSEGWEIIELLKSSVFLIWNMWATHKDFIGRQNAGNGDWTLVIMVLPFSYVLTKEKWPPLPSRTIATCFLSDLGNGQRSEVWGTYLLPGKWG